MAIATSTALILGGAALGTAAINASAQKSAAKAASAPLPPPPPSQNQVQEAALADARARALNRTQTTYTSPLGLSDNALKTQKKLAFGS